MGKPILSLSFQTLPPPHPSSPPGGLQYGTNSVGKIKNVELSEVVALPDSWASSDVSEL